MPAAFDLCAGLLVGFYHFSTNDLTPLSPPAITAHVAPTLTIGVRIDIGPVVLRPAIELGAPLVRARVTHDSAPIWTAPNFFVGLHIAFLIPTGPDPAAAAP